MQINYKKLSQICKLPFANFGKQFNMHYYEPKKGSPFWFKDNGANILAVAHLDSIQQPEFFFMNDKYIFSPVLDDRLGAYIILDMLPRLGVQYDILLTTGEEKGQSSAEYFEPEKIGLKDKKYNWMFQFDRTGTDVVMYDYETEEYKAMLVKAGFKVSDGLFSDISSLSHLMTTGFNFGTAYYDYHSLNAYAVIPELIKNVGRFTEFYQQHKNTIMPRNPEYNNGYNGWGRYDYSGGKTYTKYIYDENDFADLSKGAYGSEADVFEYCDFCGTFLDSTNEANSLLKNKVMPQYSGYNICTTCLEDYT